MSFISANSFKIKSGEVTKNDCEENYDFWMDSDRQDQSKELKGIIDKVSNIFPAHTFAYEYDGGFSPIKAIFGYSEGLGSFSRNCSGVTAKHFRKNAPNYGHMKTSDALGHDIFNFAYLGAHNPYHRRKDDYPIRPFGLFIQKDETSENFPYCHGAPCDVAIENDLVDRRNIKKYYLIPDHLRELKSHQIFSKKDDVDPKYDLFWYHFGDKEAGTNEEEYMQSLYKSTGEMRYFQYIRPSDIKAVLWPFFIDSVDELDNPNMNDNLDLYNAFVRTFPEIDVIKYGHDDDYQQNWEITLLEASQNAMKYFLENDSTFPLEV